MRVFFNQLLMKSCLRGVEVGVKAGDNALDIILHLDIAELYLIDLWKSYNIKEATKEEIEKGFCNQETMTLWKNETLEKFVNNEKVHILVGNSTDLSLLFNSESMDFVYIDASHKYNNVLEDCLAWYSCVKVGGLLGGHDYFHDTYGKEIQKAVAEFVLSKNKSIITDGDDWWIIK